MKDLGLSARTRYHGYYPLYNDRYIGLFGEFRNWRGRRDSNPRPLP